MSDDEKLQIFTNKYTTITSLKASWAPDAEWEQVVIPDEEFDTPDLVARIPDRRPWWKKLLRVYR